MANSRRILRIIEEPEPTDTALPFASVPPIVKKGTEDLVCGSCDSVIAASVAPIDVYTATAALLRNRMPSRLLLTCAACGQYNLVPPPMID